MKYRILLRDTDGREAWHEDDFDTDDFDGFLYFQWIDGNYGCDCNRSLFLLCALAHDDALDIERPCGKGAVKVVAIELEDGRRCPDVSAFNRTGDEVAPIAEWKK